MAAARLWTRPGVVVLRSRLTAVSDKDPKNEPAQSPDPRPPSGADRVSHLLDLVVSAIQATELKTHTFRSAVGEKLAEDDTVPPYLVEMLGHAVSDLNDALKRWSRIIRAADDDLTLAGLDDTVFQTYLLEAADRADYTGDLLDIDVYLATPNRSYGGHGRSAAAVDEAVRDFLDHFGLELILAGPVVWGSLLRRFGIGGSREALEKATEALKAVIVDKPQAEANILNADAITHLLQAMQDDDFSFMRFGTLLLVRITRPDGKTISTGFELTREQVAAVRAHPEWVGDPETFLSRLGEVQRVTGDEQPPAIGAGPDDNVLGEQ